MDLFLLETSVNTGLIRSKILKYLVCGSKASGIEFSTPKNLFEVKFNPLFTVFEWRFHYIYFDGQFFMTFIKTERKRELEWHWHVLVEQIAQAGFILLKSNTYQYFILQPLVSFRSNSCQEEINDYLKILKKQIIQK